MISQAYMKSILKVWNNIPSNVVNNRMAAVTTDGEEKICFRFNQGLCKNKNCKYVHKIMTEQQKKDTEIGRASCRERVFRRV